MSITLLIHDSAGRQRQVRVEKPICILGRSSSCDIQVSGEAVSSRHAKLCIYRDHVVVEDMGSLNGVCLDGKRITQPTQIRAQSTIQLGATGPTIQIVSRIAGDSLDGRPSAPSTFVESPKMWVGLGLAGIALCMFLIAAIVVIGGVLAFVPWSFGSHKMSGQAIFDRYKESTCLVCLRRPSGGTVRPVGTAFLIDRKGLFATNAHVVNFVADLKKELPDLSVVIISQGGKHEFPILGWLPHRHYDPNAKYSTDVGLLSVATNSTSGMTPVPIAGNSDLHRIMVGSDLCYIGYPVFYEGEYGELKKILPRFFHGTVARTMDLHEEEANFDRAVLMEHDMYSWGGASGSPIFGSSGEVVALHFAGGAVVNEKTGEATKQQASIKFGIRADLLRDVIKDFREKQARNEIAGG